MAQNAQEETAFDCFKQYIWVADQKKTMQDITIHLQGGLPIWET